VSPHPTPVSTYVRATLGVFTALSVWQCACLLVEHDRIEELLPSVMDVDGWIAVWTLVAIACAIAVGTGKDFPSRMAFGAMATASVMGAVTVVADQKPMGVQFWTFGMAVVLAVLCFVMLLSPLRIPPKGLDEGLFRK